MMRVLITGVTGFAGGHVAEALLACHDTHILGVSRAGTWPHDLRHLAKHIPLHACDLREAQTIAGIIKEAAPDWVMHLAGFASVAAAEYAGTDAWADNLTATRNLYDAVRHGSRQARILFAGSGLVYGDNTTAEPPDESCALLGRTVYATSKCAADHLSAEYGLKYGMRIVRARPLNHIGPRQGPQFAIASFARQIALIENGQQPPMIETGNLNSRRDLTDVRDVAQAYIALLKLGRPGEAYNIASDRLYSIQTVLQHLLDLSDVQVEVRRQEHLLRQSDPPVLRIDSSKLRRETGWQPRFRLGDTLRDTLDYWRGRVGSSTLAA